jgi:hypothetical protein
MAISNFRKMSLIAIGILSFQIASCKPGGGGNKDGNSDQGQGPSAPSGEDPNRSSGTIDTGDPDDLNQDLPPGGTVELTGGSLDVAVVSAGSLAVAPALAATEIGMATPLTLESLQYRFQRIQICRDLQTTGSGYNNPTDCMTIYSEQDPEQYDNFGYDEAKADTTHYVDLMDSTSLEKLSSQLQLTSKDAHEYNYGVINWYQPIKVKASVTVAEAGQATSTTVYTKDGPMVTELIGMDNFKKFITRSANVTTGPAELAIIRHNNGGSWFKFAKPFVVTDDDIKNKTNFKLDLAFNPDAIVKAVKNGGNGQIMGVPDATFPDIGLDHPSYPSTYYSFEVPMIALNPIAHPVDKHVRKDTYLVHVNLTEDLFDMRIEVYSLDGDPKKTVFGVDFETLLTAETLETPMSLYDPFFVEESDGGEIIMQTYDKKPIFSGFHRLGAVNDTGTVGYLTGSGRACLKADGNNCYSDPNYSHEYSFTYEFTDSVVLP